MAGEGKCFTFLWKLENISYCYQKQGEQIKSPAFVVDAIDGTKWKLILYPRGERGGISICYYLNREVDSKGGNKVEVKYDLAFISEDGSSLISYGSMQNVFHKGEYFGYNGFVKVNDLYSFKRSTLLPQDTLRARCRIWKCDGKLKEDVLCTILTRIGVEKRYLQWNVKNFSTLEPGEKCNYQIKSIENDLPLMSVDLSLAEELSSKEIRLELSLQDKIIKFSTLTLSLVDASGDKIECNKEKMWFDDPASCKQLTFSFTKEELLEKKSMHLPNDTLSLMWEWAFSKGVASEEIEEDKHGCICPEIKISDAQHVNNDQTALFNVLADNVKSLYDEHFLSDVKLKTKTSVFPAHKFVLSASSSVFKAMFSNDMKEKNTDCVHIEDVSDDTVSRMLLFIYTARVGDLTWEMASHLYVAADKYAILSLKNVCSSFLKDNLSSRNACEVLLLSDFHADGDLKSVVQDYILKNGKQIINSEEWKVLLETNAKLAAEALAVVFK